LDYEGKDHHRGDIVESQESYAGRDFLEPVEEPKEPEKTAEKKPNIFIYSTCAISEHKEKKKDSKKAGKLCLNAKLSFETVTLSTFFSQGILLVL